MILAIRCLFRRHQPDRRRAWSDDYVFRAPCRRCGTPLMRGAGPWHIDKSAR